MAKAGIRRTQQLVHIYLMHGGCTICMEMCTNFVWIGMGHYPMEQILKDVQVLRNDLIEVVAILMMRQDVLRNEEMTILRIVLILSLVFALSELSNDGCSAQNDFLSPPTRYSSIWSATEMRIRVTICNKTNKGLI